MNILKSWLGIKDDWDDVLVETHDLALANNNLLKALNVVTTPVTTMPVDPTSPTNTIIPPVTPTQPVVTPTASYTKVYDIATTNPLLGATLYVNPNSSAAQWIQQNPTDPDVQYIHQIAIQPTFNWLGYDNTQTSEQNQSNVYNKVLSYLKSAAGLLCGFSVYGIPNRDNGGPSSGGAPDQATYNDWLGAIGAAILAFGCPKVLIVFEADALGFAYQMAQNGNYAQYGIIQEGISILTKNPNSFIYIDVSMWNYPDATAMIAAMQFMINSDKLSGIRGVCFGTSSYNTDQMDAEFANAFLAAFPGLRYITDTGRNGKGPAPAGQYANIPGMALGAIPNSQTPTDIFDGNVWVKPPGESDAAVNGGPNPGVFFPSYAVSLVQNQ